MKKNMIPVLLAAAIGTNLLAGCGAASAQAAFDIFRFEDGKIAEHWDVMETIADKDTWAIEKGKF